MTSPVNGMLVPVGGGDSIPLLRPVLTIGRRESCDICMRFPNVSGVHCELAFRDGFWHLRDLNSTNGVKVNGNRVQDKVLFPDDEIAIGKRRFTITYTAPRGKPMPEASLADLFGKSLLEKAGLERRPRPVARRAVDPKELTRSNDEDDD